MSLDARIFSMVMDKMLQDTENSHYLQTGFAKVSLLRKGHLKG